MPHHIALLMDTWTPPASCAAACGRARLLQRRVRPAHAAWLERLSCSVLSINDDPSAPFPHAPEPSRATAAQVAAIVRAGHADVGFVHDADGERLAMVDETGRALSEEVTLALAAAIALERRVGPGGHQRVDHRRHRPRGRPFRCRGDSHAGRPDVHLRGDRVARRGLGGEGNGGVVVPAIHLAHDAAACIGLVLDHLAASGEPLSALIDTLPTLPMMKEVHPVEPHLLYSVLQNFRDDVQDERCADVDLTDGVKVTWPDAWLHVRASNTESLLRVIAEADTTARARDLADWARDRLKI